MSQDRVRPDGARIRAARLVKGWTQEQLAKTAGYKLSVIQKLEEGSYFSMRCLQNCAEALGVKTEELIMEQGNETCPDPPSSADPNHGQGAGVLVDSDTAYIEIVIDRDFDTYSKKAQSRLLSAISTLLGVSGDIRVVHKRRGTVKLTLALTPRQADQLLRAVQRGEFREFGIIDATILPTSADEFANLLARVREGDEEALAVFTIPLNEKLKRAAHRWLGPVLKRYVDSMDIVHSAQKSLLICLRGGKYDITDQSKLTALAMRILQRKIALKWRRVQKEPVLDKQLAKPVQAELIQHLMKHMNKSEKELFMLRLQGHTLQSAAKLLGLDPRYARVLMGRMKERLAAMFDLPPGFP